MLFALNQNNYNHDFAEYFHNEILRMRNISSLFPSFALWSFSFLAIFTIRRISIMSNIKAISPQSRGIRKWRWKILWTWRWRQWKPEEKEIPKTFLGDFCFFHFSRRLIRFVNLFLIFMRTECSSATWMNWTDRLIQSCKREK